MSLLDHPDAFFVPPRVRKEHYEERQRREAEAFKAIQDDHKFAWKKEFDAQLDRIVHGMKLVFCPDPAPVDAVAMGAQPGRWNLIWPSYHGGPVNVHPWTSEDGGYREPDSEIFDWIARADLWSERVQRDRRRIAREAEEAKSRRLERERADRDQEVLERYLSVSRAQVSMNRDAPWSQNQSGARGRKSKG